MPDSKIQRGSLFAVGGREVRSGTPGVLAHFVQLCGGSNARLLVITTASSEPAKRQQEYQTAFRLLGVQNLSFFHQDHREEAGDPGLLAALRRADGVYFTGGSQLKLVTTIGGTPLESEMRLRFHQGLHVGGTSAGASALSTIMIARGTGYSAPRLSSVRMSPGLGLLPGVILDQHFRERDRIGRLLAAILCNPSLLGFGLDEDTAFGLDGDDRVTVFGSGTLTIVDGAHLEATDLHEVLDTEPVAFAGMRLHVLTAGWVYDLTQRRVVKRLLPAAVADFSDEVVLVTRPAATHD